MAEAKLKEKEPQEEPKKALKSSLSKAQKAALIFLFLEEKGAASLFQHMSDEEVKQIGTTLLSMDEIPVDELNLVLSEFYETLGSPVPYDFSGKRIFEKLVERSIPEERRGRIFSIQDIKGGQGSVHNPIEKLLVSLTPSQIFNLIEDEHSQTAAVVLTLIEPDQSKLVISYFEGERQSDIVYRMALLSSVSEDVITILHDYFKPIIDKYAEVGKLGDKGMNVAGVDIVLKFLRTVDWGKADEIIEGIEKSNPQIARVLKKKVFTINDLQRTDNNGIRALLKNVETGSLAIAMKVAAPGLQNMFFQNMSTRAATILREDMEVLSPKAEDIEVAVNQLLTEAKNLVRSGEMVMSPPKE